MSEDRASYSFLFPMKNSPLNSAASSRRHFLKTSSLLAGSAFVLPRFSIGQSGASANSKLNIAFIGVGPGQGRGNLSQMRNENIVAFCDVDPAQIAETKKNFPNARTFGDYRQMFDKMGNEIDAVGIATPDNTHFVTAMTAADLGKHLFVQKPLVHNLYELRTLCRKARENKLVTQMGNQGRAFEGMRLIKEWFDAGVLGEVREVVAWTNRPHQGYGFRSGERKKLPAAQSIGYVATTSNPSVSVSKSFVKKRKFCRFPALVTPAAIRASISAWVNVKSCDRFRRSSTSILK